MYGVFSSCILTRGSDIDVTIYRSDAQDEGDAAAAVQVLDGGVLPLLSKSPRFEVVRLVSGARIPVLSLRFDGATDVDLSCHNTEPLRNSQLLCAYAQASPLARGLALLVKLWSKAAGVCGAQSGHLSSYALALMVCVLLPAGPPRLRAAPALHAAIRWLLARAHRDALGVPAIPARGAAAVLRVLLPGVCVGQRGRLGAPRPAAQGPLPGVRSAAERHGAGRRLHVEDPFLTRRNLNCVLGLEQDHHLASWYSFLSRSVSERSYPNSVLSRASRPPRRRR
ncbi:unnamed protein product [Prorocentrum cordatum]|uniref:Poly(A) RNA polymerase mitochondrial-like central palm domain-containing protein n=1 Tax=Prorocentrum cordatum TaxID=2364126 RepID=A0ABN9TQ87_9DINO|nr:unnamed protein product [Polarella glacialis]